MAKRGRRPRYVIDPATGDPIIDLSREGETGRFYTTSNPLKRFGTDFHRALMKFRRWQRNQDKITAVPMPTVRPGFTEEQVAEDGGDVQPGEYLQNWPPVNVPESVVWQWLREQIHANPKHAAEMSGIPELAHLLDVRPPESSLPLAEVGELYNRGKKTVSTDQRRKVALAWRDFSTVVGSDKTLRDVTAEDIERFHSWVWDTAKKKNLSPTWINARFADTTTALRYALKRGNDTANIRRVLDHCAIFERARSNGTDPKPISKEDFAELLIVCDEKWAAVMLVALNCALYPQEVAALLKSEIDLDKKTLVSAACNATTAITKPKRSSARASTR